MHEIDLISKMVLYAEKVARDNHADHIAGITVEVGELSGVLPVLLEEYYPIVVQDREMLKDSRLHIITVPGEGLCDECHTLYNVAAFQGACPKCGSRYKQILGGRDFMVKNILIGQDHPRENQKRG